MSFLKSAFSKIVAWCRFRNAQAIVFGQMNDQSGPSLPIDAAPEIALSKIDTGQPLPGVSLVACCMNREENLFKVLWSWLATDADEIVIVDWSSTSELWPKISEIADPRIKVIRIDGEKNWVLTHALNVGLRFASRDVIFKVDCDIELTPDFFKNNFPQPGEFVRGFWKSGLETNGEGQQFINGTFGAYKMDLRQCNYYDERILTYGWDDSDLYMRMEHDYGLAGRLIDPRSLRHIEQAEDQRLANQVVPKNRFLGKFEPTEFEGAKNKFYTFMMGNWASYYPSQDYCISKIEPQFYRGRRVTNSIARNSDVEQLAKLFAAKQLANWASKFPELGNLGEIDIEFAQLLRDAHAINKSRDLIESIKSGKGVYFIRCKSGPCRSALVKTLNVMQDHYPSFAQNLYLAEDLADISLIGDGRNVLRTSGALIEILSGRANAIGLNGILCLGKELESGGRMAGHISISIRTLAAEVIRKTSQFAQMLASEYESLATPVKGTCLVTSLYDEQNLIRLIEYLACVVENLKIFEQVAICYEASNGLTAAVLQVISQELTISPGRILILPYQKRPTFEDLFSVKSFLPTGTVITVANADIAFDASFSKVKEIDLSRNIVVLSRRDIAKCGTEARLIRLGNGSPNTFSADAWIFSTPFEADFHLDYPIGSFHCDSFINHQISKSSRYEVINLCLDINAFHLHDERFNSSAEKHQRDFDVIEESRRLEYERNGGANPIIGVAWSTVSTASLLPQSARLQTWCPRVVFIQLGRCVEITFGHLILLHWLINEICVEGDLAVYINLKRSDFDGLMGRMFARHLVHFAFGGNVSIGIDDPFDISYPLADGITVRHSTFNDLEEWLINGVSQKIKEFISWPQREDNKFLRCEFDGELTTESTPLLLNNSTVIDRLLPDLISLYDAMPNNSSEKNLLASLVVPDIKSVFDPNRKSAGI